MRFSMELMVEVSRVGFGGIGPKDDELSKEKESAVLKLGEIYRDQK